MTISAVLKTAIFISLFFPALAIEPRITSIGPSVPYEISEIFFSDLDQDGDRDMIVIDNVNSKSLYTWYENNGGNEFLEPRVLHYPQSGDTQFLGINIGTNDDPSLISYRSSAGSIQLSHSPLFVQGNQSIHLPLFDYVGQKPHSLSLEDNESIQVVTPYGNSINDIRIWSISPEGLLIPWSEMPLPLPDGIFQNKNYSGRKFTSADLDDDGDLDLIAHLDPNWTAVYERTDERSFSGNAVLLESHLQAFDLDLDGDVDLIDTNSTFPSYYLNEGTFEFVPRSFDMPDYRAAHPVASMEKGESRRWVTTNFNSEEIVLTEWKMEADVMVKHTEVSLDSSSLNTTQTSSLRTQSADLDFDGSNEILILRPPSLRDRQSEYLPNAPRIHNTVLVYKKGDAEPRNYFRVNTKTLFVGLSLNEVVIGDFNNDGFLDVLAGSDASGNFHLFFSDGDGDFVESPHIVDLYPSEMDRSSFSIRGLRTVNFDGDEFLDLGLTYARHDNDFVEGPDAACLILKGLGEGLFEEPMLSESNFVVSESGQCDISEFVDWDADGDLDAILEGYWIENIDGELSDVRKPLLANGYVTDVLGNPRYLEGHRIGDVDGDGYPDYMALAYNVMPGFPPIIGITYQSEFAVGFNDGSGNIASIATYPSSFLNHDALGNPVLFPPYLIDLDLDGALDIVLPDVINDALGNPVTVRSLFLNVPGNNPRSFDNAFTQPLDISFPLQPSLGDFDGDGILEYPGPESFVRATADGPVVSPSYNFRQNIHLGFLRKTIAVADFDHDGDSDTLYFNTSNYAAGNQLDLVRNLLVDERSAISRELTKLGYAPALSTPTADADGDGRSNGLEEIEGTSPTLADDSPPQDLTPRWSPDGQQLTFRRRKDAPSLQLHYDVEVSINLLNWQRVPVEEISTDSIDEIWEWVTVSVNKSAPKLHYRVNGNYDPYR